MARLSSERAVVQNPLVRYATEAGWTYIDPEEALRLRQGGVGAQGLAPLLLWDIFIQRVQTLNPGIVDHLKAEDLAKRLTRLRPCCGSSIAPRSARRAVAQALKPVQARAGFGWSLGRYRRLRLLRSLRLFVAGLPYGAIMRSVSRLERREDSTAGKGTWLEKVPDTVFPPSMRTLQRLAQATRSRLLISFEPRHVKRPSG